MLYAYDQPFFVIDTYTKRIFSRLGFLKIEDEYEKYQSLFHTKLEKDVKLYQEYHALIVEHAKKHCKKTPECKNCPITSVCKKFI